MRRLVLVGQRCHARDANDARCAVVGEHQIITNSNGQPATVHETKHSIWSVPLADTLR